MHIWVHGGLGFVLHNMLASGFLLPLLFRCIFYAEYAQKKCEDHGTTTEDPNMNIEDTATIGRRHDSLIIILNNIPQLLGANRQNGDELYS